MSNHEKHRTIFAGSSDISARLGVAPITLGQKHERSPWVDYHKVLVTDTTYLAVHKLTGKVVAFRSQGRFEQTRMTLLRTVSHRNLVTFQAAYHDHGHIYLAFDPQLTPIVEIISTPRGRLEVSDIAYICSATLKGLAYLHSELKINHGGINNKSVVVHKDGTIKIGGIEHCMLRDPTGVSIQEDILATGKMVRDILEPDSAVGDPGSLKLQRPPMGSIAIQAFLDMTRFSSTASLLQHPFIKLARGGNSLIPYIIVAREVCLREVEIFPSSE